MGEKNLTGNGDINLELAKCTIPFPEVINVEPKNSNFGDKSGKY